MTHTVGNKSSHHRMRSSAAPSMSSDSSMPLKSTTLLGHETKKSSLALPSDEGQSCSHFGGPGEPLLPRYFLLGRALALQGQSERVGRVSRKLSPFTTPSSSRSVSDTIESACEVALSSVLEMEDHDRTCMIDIDDEADDDDMDRQMIRKYRRDLLKDDMGLFLDRLSRMRNELHDDSDSQSSDEEEEDDDIFSHFGY